MSRRLWCIGTIIGVSSPRGVNWTQSQAEICLTDRAIRLIEHELLNLSEAMYLETPQELILLELSGTGTIDLRRRWPGSDELIIGNGLWNLMVGTINGRLTIGYPSDFDQS